LAVSIDRVSEYLERLEATSSRLELARILGELLAELDAEEIEPAVYMVQGQIDPPFRGGEMGMSTKLVLRAIDRALEGTRERPHVPLGELLAQVGDPGILAEHVFSHHRVHPSDFLSVFSRLKELSELEGHGSQDDKIEALAGLFRSLSPRSSRFVARFVVGRLRLGVGDATIVDAMARLVDLKNGKAQIEKAYNLCSDLGLVARSLKRDGFRGLETFQPQPGFPIRMALCERLQSGEEIFEKIGRCAVESKYDGFRCQVHCREGNVQVFSRNLEETTAMFPEIVEAARALFGTRSAIFEGEALGFNAKTGGFFPFQVTITRKRKHNVLEKSQEIPLKALIFDLLYLDGESWVERPFEERRKKLESLFPSHHFEIDEHETAPRGVFGTSRLIHANHPSVIDQFFDEVVEEGFEGIVAKRLKGVYTAGSRNFNWIKLKRSYQEGLSDTLDLTLIGYYRGKGQRTRLGIGAVLAAAYDTALDRYVSIARIGSGLTEENWVALRQMLDEIRTEGPPHNVSSGVEPDFWVQPRYVVTVRADEITRSPTHTCGKTDTEEGYALRFPRMVSMVRADKRASDATTADEVRELYRQQREAAPKKRKSQKTKPSTDGPEV
jgi:DNA ligase-1